MMVANDLAVQLGLKKYPRSWRGRCPACDYSGTFSVRAGRDGRALLFCASCQDRDALAKAAALAMGEEKQSRPIVDRDEGATRLRKGQAALRLWRGSEATLGTPADRYLAARGLPGLAASTALRFRADTWHPEGGRFPALIALVSAPDGSPVAVHRTFITRDGGKAEVEPVKASLGPVWQGAVRLHDVDPNRPLVIGEGIETSASAGRLLNLPAWAAISAGNLGGGLVLPNEVRRVVIAADADRPGERAAREAAIRWQREGRSVQIARPDEARYDFNDILRGGENA